MLNHPYALLLFFLLRVDIEPPRQREHRVAGNGVVPGLSAALGIDGIARGGELVQDVEALELGEQMALDERARELRVPHPVGGVHLALLIATAGEHRHIGGELEVPGQAEHGVGGDVIVTRMDVVEALAAAVDIRIGTATVERELVAVVGPESQFQVVRSTPVVHDAAHALVTR